MPLSAWSARSQWQPGAPGLRSLTVTAGEWRAVMEDVRAAGGRLVALWASREDRLDTVRAAALAGTQGLIVSLPLEGLGESYAGLEDLFPAATRMQRAVRDLSGVSCTDPDARPWLRHAAWPESYRPLVDTRCRRTSPPPSTATSSSVSRASGCTRSPWVRCTPAPSSRGTFACRSWAKSECPGSMVPACTGPAAISAPALDTDELVAVEGGGDVRRQRGVDERPVAPGQAACRSQGRASGSVQDTPERSRTARAPCACTLGRDLRVRRTIPPALEQAG